MHGSVFELLVFSFNWCKCEPFGHVFITAFSSSCVTGQSSAKNITEITQKSAAGSGPGPDLVSVCAGSGKLAEKSVTQTELNEIPISAYAAVRQ